MMFAGYNWVALRLTVLLLGITSLFAQPSFQVSRINVGCNPTNVLTGDFNGDHAADLAFVCTASSANPISVVLGNGDGTFRAPNSVPGPALGTGAGNKIIAADFDGDGKTDLAYIAANGNLIVLLSAGDGTFRSLVTTPTNSKLSLAATADLDGDGRPDLIFVSGLGDNLVSYTLGKGAGTFAAPIVVPWPDDALAANQVDPNPHSINVLTADFNGDGKPDLTVGVLRNIRPASNGPVYTEVRAFTLLSKQGGFGLPVTEAYFANSGMLAADFDGDGKQDLAVWGSGGFFVSTLAVFPSFAVGTSSLGVPFNLGVTVDGALAAGDLLGDGKSEFLVGSGALNAVSVYTLQANHTVQRSLFIDWGTTPKDIAVVDLNGDGKLDFVTANTSSASIAINTSTIAARLTGALNGASFATGQPLAPGSLASAFGTALASVPGQANSVPLPLNLAGLSMTVGGVPAPLLYVAGSQVNFQVPWTVPPGPADIVATVNGTALAKLTVTIAAVAPGIFSLQSGQAIAINLDGSLAAPAGSIPGIATHPAKPGDTILVLATGLGAVTPSIATGDASTDALRATNVTPAVLVGGASASVAFSGLAPQFVGVNQLNVVVPAVGAGVVSLQIDAGGIRSTDKVTIAVANP